MTDRVRRRPGSSRAGVQVDAEADLLNAKEELDVALRVIGELGNRIQNADIKAGVLAAVLGVCVAGLGAQSDALRRTLHATEPMSFSALMLFVLFLVAAMGFVGAAHVPRLVRGELQADSVSPFALPLLARRRDSARNHRGAAELTAQAWAQAEVLAVIAVRKYACYRAALACAGLCLGCFLGWTLLAATVV